MAQVTFTSAWTDTTEQTAYAGPCRLKSVEVIPYDTQVNTVFVQLFDATNPTPGTTEPTMVMPVGSLASQGRKKRKFLFPGGGFRFATALTLFCSTTSIGATAATTTSLPPRIVVDFSRET